MPKSLVIVESPTKARTIARFLDDDFVVESSIGHIRDLPDSAGDIPDELRGESWSRLGIDVEHDFKPLYVVPSDKKKQVSKLKALLKGADVLYLATDEDREGESISWHLQEVLQPRVPTHRLVFHEITREAIRAALASPRDIDTRLVTAQETRRLLDRLFGYEVSPVLWRKIAPSLSAGRVQSVAIRMVVQRERERMAFRVAHYWDLAGTFSRDGKQPFTATLINVDGMRLATGRDFEDTTGQLPPGHHLVHLDEAGAARLRAALQNERWRVVKSERKPYADKPPAPFTTSTLQQEANRKLGLTSRNSMRVAQALYERGYITYMRTDSTTLSDQALSAARNHIRSHYGADYLPPAPRVYKSQVKNAQEAHEAIRPAGDAFQVPESLRGELNVDEFRLYEMIWKRTVASQMPNATGQRMTLQVQGGGALFQATGKTIEFPGYLRAYVEGSDDPDGELGDQEKLLPDVAVGDALTCERLEPAEHSTQPPARYSEASLIKELEKNGIGRPSTYASIIDTIIRRAYVVKKGNALVPTFVAFAVVQLLEQFFERLVDQHFTAEMEDALDAISTGEGESLRYLRHFYYGSGESPGLAELLKAEIDARQACTIPLGTGSDGQAINIRVGRYGPYLERNSDRASLPEDLAPDELTLARAEELLAAGNQPQVLGTHPQTGQNVYVKSGRYGPYVQLGETGESPRNKGLLPGQSPERLTLDDALGLLSLPRNVGRDPDTGEDIEVDLGRYGPYAKRGKDTRSLPGAEALFSFTLDEAVALFKQEKRARFGQAATLRELGKAPQSGADISLKSGRYGPYVTDGQLNASLPRSADPDALTLEAALELLQARAARGPVTRGRRTGAKAGAKAKPPAKVAKPKAARKAKSADQPKPAAK
ncbi:MAG: type I DNA topoisomerase, partial [Candidatus Lambdaproteobacteria bacterium]|nr:type I DNA topoisomerase [Candidatus Lambdaproteobacteria bacterium]